MALVLDTGVIVAALNSTDKHHRACVDLLSAAREPLIVPAAVLVEVDYWVCEKLGVETWQIFVEDVARGAYLLESTTEADLVRAAELQGQYRNLNLGFTDAAVIALCERLGEGKVATIDRRDFAVVQPRHVEWLELLPADLVPAS